MKSFFIRKTKPQIKAPRVTPLEGVSTHGAAMRVRGVENPQGFGNDERRFANSDIRLSYVWLYENNHH
ncbi:MAG: hypothetical protein WA102_13455 [Candidatus Methanoperedens sp.]